MYVIVAEDEGNTGRYLFERRSCEDRYAVRYYPLQEASIKFIAYYTLYLANYVLYLARHKPSLGGVVTFCPDRLYGVLTGQHFHLEIMPRAISRYRPLILQ